MLPVGRCARFRLCTDFVLVSFVFCFVFLFSLFHSSTVLFIFKCGSFLPPHLLIIPHILMVWIQKGIFAKRIFKEFQCVLTYVWFHCVQMEQGTKHAIREMFEINPTKRTNQISTIEWFGFSSSFFFLLSNLLAEFSCVCLKICAKHLLRCFSLIFSLCLWNSIDTGYSDFQFSSVLCVCVCVHGWGLHPFWDWYYLFNPWIVRTEQAMSKSQVLYGLFQYIIQS